MRALVLTIIAGIAVSALPAAPPVAADPAALRVCLEEDSPPYSFKFRKRSGGFDLAVAGAVARKLGRPLEVQWFESENDDENVPQWESNALIADGLCDLVAGYPMFAAALGVPAQPTGAIPEYDGMKRSERGRIVQLGTLVPTRPYHRAGFAVVLAPSAEGRTVSALRDLEDLRLGVEVSTLASAMLFRYDGGRLIADITHVAPSKDVLAQLEAGTFDATLIELHRFDSYRRKHPETTLTWSGWLHPVGINMAFVTLARHEPLRLQVDAALAELIAAGELERFADEAGMTYVPPGEPTILKAITPGMLVSG